MKSNPFHPFKEAPRVELPDPSTGRALTDQYRSSRRALILLCAVAFAWSTAQFRFDLSKVDAFGFSLDLRDASVPIVLGVALLYQTIRWLLEFGMMSRHTRRWRLAQIDFKMCWLIARLSLLFIAAGALDRSIKNVVILASCLIGAGLIVGLLTLLLMPAAMWVRMVIRDRSGRISVANASIEAFAWSTVFSIGSVALAIFAFGTALLLHPSLWQLVWASRPDTAPLLSFIAVLLGVFLSFFVEREMLRSLFSTPLDYYTERRADGALRITFVPAKREPLL